jgi:hypothetical protein
MVIISTAVSTGSAVDRGRRAVGAHVICDCGVGKTVFGPAGSGGKGLVEALQGGDIRVELALVEETARSGVALEEEMGDEPGLFGALNRFEISSPVWVLSGEGAAPGREHFG